MGDEANVTQTGPWGQVGTYEMPGMMVGACEPKLRPLDMRLLNLDDPAVQAEIENVLVQIDASRVLNCSDESRRAKNWLQGLRTK